MEVTFKAPLEPVDASHRPLPGSACIARSRYIYSKFIGTQIVSVIVSVGSRYFRDLKGRGTIVLCDYFFPKNCMKIIDRE